MGNAFGIPESRWRLTIYGGREAVLSASGFFTPESALRAIFPHLPRMNAVERFTIIVAKEGKKGEAETTAAEDVRRTD